MKPDYAGVRDNSENSSLTHSIMHFKVQSGKFILQTRADQSPESFDYVRGRIVNIEIRKHATPYGENCEVVILFDFDGRPSFDITVPFSSAVCTQLFSRLAKLKTPEISFLRIDAYLINQYTNFRVLENGRPVVFLQMPQTRIINASGEKVDTQARDAEIQRVINDLNAKIRR